MRVPARTPDITNLHKVLRREKPARATLFELFLNESLYERLTGRAVPKGCSLERMKFLVDAYAAAGYDYASVSASAMSFPAQSHGVSGKQTISLNRGFVITDEASFAQYPWPDPESFDYTAMEAVEPFLPGNMKLMALGPGGVLENAISLVGYDNLCFMLYEEPALAKAIFDAIGERLLRYYEIAAGFSSVGLIMANDDWGFNTQTFLSPDTMRTHVFPWYRRIVEAAHRHGKPIALHSCGNLNHVMDDVIDLGFDGKHSFEDNILRVEDAYDRWHDRIAILGGIDVDFIVRGTPEGIRARSDAMLDRAADGGYALGTGNSVAPYVPEAHYLAMTRAALDRD